MRLRLSFHGGAGEVTGSKHLLEAGDARVLLDCGLFQGHRHEAIRKNKELPFDPRTLDAVLLSHAHIDHSGGLPILAARGAACPIHSTRPTCDICGIMLMDAAHLQEADAAFFNKIHRKDGQRIEPLYGQREAEAALALFREHPYDESFQIKNGVSARFLNAGHVLGSAMIEVDVQTPKGRRRTLFTGDLGRRNTILMEAPAIPSNVDYLLIESTYGNRSHEDISQAESRLAEVVRRVVEERGKLLIPSFALERTQEIVFILEKLRREKAIPPIPVYVDSPMAVNISEIFARHARCFCFGPQFKAYVSDHDDPFGFDSVRYVRTVGHSKHLNALPGPMVILSASGMCEGGRVLHHLRNNIGADSTTILIVGYQARGTLGRRLLDGAKKVRIFGLEHEVAARVEAIHALSAHADREDLLAFIKALAPRPRKIFLVHGDPEDRQRLAERLAAEGISRVECPDYGDSVELD